MEFGKNRVMWGGSCNQMLPRNGLLLRLRWSFQSLNASEGFVLVQNGHKNPSACAGKGVGQEGSEAEVLLSTGMSLACR